MDEQPITPQPQPVPPAPTSFWQRFTRKQWIVAGVLAVVIACCACGGITAAINAANGANSANASGNHIITPPAHQAPQATATATHTPVWTTFQTFKGNGIKTTATFTAPDDWKLNWTCNPSSFMGGQYNLIVTLYSSDGTMQDIPINTICKSGNTSDSTEEHQGGQVYLDVNSEGDWTLTLQELK